MKTVSIYIPKQDNDGSSNKTVIETCISDMLDLYGGCTTLDAKGYWKDKEGTVYTDNITVVQSSTNTKDLNQDMNNLARSVLDMTDQLAVFIDVDGNSTVIDK